MKKRISGYALTLLKIRLLFLFLKLACKYIHSLSDVLHAFKTGMNHSYSLNGLLFPQKAFYINGKYYWGLYKPGFPSSSFKYLLDLGISKALNKKNPNQAILIIAITKKCSLNCEHCFEWDEINKKDVFSEDILDKYFLDASCLGQLFFTGGEPLNRYRVLSSLVNKYRERADLWVISSGLGFNDARAKELKSSGLTGIVISLDHFEVEKHDQFRGLDGSYHAAVNAIKIANNQGLITTLSLCITNNNLSHAFLDSYMALAAQLEVSFVQILEPKAAGKFLDMEVQLQPQNLILLERFYLNYNKKKQFPLIVYPEHYKRMYGCNGMDWYAYIDTNGELHPCPFCKNGNKSCVNKNHEIPLIQMRDQTAGATNLFFNKNNR